MLVDTVENAVEVLAGRPLVALTGAGLSTDSGIPDYRGPGSPRRTPDDLPGVPLRADRAAPLLGAQPRRLDPHRHAPRPTPATARSPRWSAAGVLRGLITQNVDGLHTAAGSRAVIDLHGRIADVICTACGRRSSRAELQQRLAAAQPGLRRGGGRRRRDRTGRRRRARRHRRLPAGRVHGCGGLLKPDVVFFGENVPRERVARAYAMVDATRDAARCSSRAPR